MIYSNKSLEELDKERLIHIAKTLIHNATLNSGGELTLLSKYCMYGGQAYDSQIETTVSKDQITFKTKFKVPTS